MLTGLCQIARRGLLSQTKLDIISNDLANVGTFGYKKSGVSFKLPSNEELQDQKVNYSLLPYGVQAFTDFSSGSYRHTANPLDISIQGEGFFVVESPQGNLYTRKGDFSLDSQGRIVTQDGRLVLGEGGPITITGGEIHVDEEGNVYSGQDLVDKLKIVTFQELSVLEKAEGAYFRLRDPSLAGGEKKPQGIQVMQGFLELSNVDVVVSMVEMLSILRGYEAYKNVMDILREADSKVAQEVALLR
ncbi:MAG: flagellar basal-body rod protein FlgF [Desulfatiglandales bacterium]